MGRRLGRHFSPQDSGVGMQSDFQRTGIPMCSTAMEKHKDHVCFLSTFLRATMGPSSLGSVVPSDRLWGNSGSQGTTCTHASCRTSISEKKRGKEKFVTPSSISFSFRQNREEPSDADCMITSAGSAGQ